MRPHLKNQLDWDNDVDRDFREIARHMLDWDSTLATHLKLSHVDVDDIKRKFSMDPELQR